MDKSLTLDSICKKSDLCIEDKLLTAFDRLDRKNEPKLYSLIVKEFDVYSNSDRFDHVGDYMFELYARVTLKYWGLK